MIEVAHDTTSGSPRQLWLLRAACFTQFFAFGIVFAYGTVWMRKQGMGEFVIGQVQAVAAMLLLLSGLACGVLADLTGRPHFILTVGCVLLSVSLFYLAHCRQPVQFFIYAVIAGVSTPMVLNMLPLLAVSIVEGDAAGRKYGAYRVFGSLGYTLSTLLLPLFIKDIGRLIQIAAFVLLAVPLPILSLRYRPRPRHTRVRIRGGLRNGELLVFVGAVFFYGLASPAIFRFTPTYALRLGAGTLFIGVLAAILGIVSLVGLPMCGRIADRFGLRVLLILVFVAQPLRVLLLSFVNQYEYLLLPQLLHTLTFCGLEIGGLLFVTRLAGRSGRGMAVSIYMGAIVLARAIAAPMAGYLAEEFGYPLMYRASAGAALIGLIIFLFVTAGREKASCAHRGVARESVS